MKRIECVFGILVVALLLFSCENKSRQAKPQNFEEEPPVEQVEYVPARDTIASHMEEKTAPEAPPQKVKVSPSSNSSYSPRSEKSSYDNMRGFDPASEDDMDDNGMSRYMENNDEEGWE